MTISSRQDRRPFTRMQRLVTRSTLFLLASLLFAFSGEAAASLGCDIQDSSTSTTQTGPAGSNLTYKFDIIDLGGCSGTMSGNVSKTFDNTGGASSNVGAWSGTAGQTITVTITLGPNSGSTSSWQVTCSSGCTGGTTINWTANTPDVFALSADPPTSIKMLQGTSATMNAHYFRNGVDANDSTIWTDTTAPNGFFSANNPVFTDDSTGLVTNTYFNYNSGTATHDIMVEGNPTECGSACPAPVHFFVTVEDPDITPVTPPGGSASVGQNTSLTLKVKYAGPTLAVSDGTQIDWSVTSEPNVGDGTFSAQDGGPPSFKRTSTTGGFTQVTFNVTNPGTYTVRAAHCPDGCDDETTFTITVTSQVSDLSVTKTDSPDPVAPGGQLTYTIAVQNAGPDPASNLTLTDTLPAGVTFASLTAPNGWNCSTPAVGSGGTVSCSKNTLGATATSTLSLLTNVASTVPPGSTLSNTATIASRSFDSDNSNNSSTTTTAVTASAPSLTVTKVLTGTADNDSSGAVSAGDRLDYRVTAHNSGNTPLTAVHVTDDHFAAAQDCATLATGADCVLTGSYIVTAADVSAGSVTNIGTATSNQVAGNQSSVVTPIVVVVPVTLGIGSGDGQSTPVNTPFPQPLTVVANGTPPPSLTAGTARSGLAVAAAPGITINWSVLSGSAFVTAPTSTTNASGIASMTVQAGPVPGPIVIHAERADDPSAFVNFHLTATAVAPPPSFASLPNLTPNQQAIANALDAICSGSPSTGGGSSTTPLAATSTSSNTADLIARCQELADAILTDPDGVIAALDSLFAEIALVQSESSLLAAESQFDNIKARIAALRSGTNRTSFGGLALNTSSGRLPVGTMFQSLLGQDDTDKPGSAKEVGADFSRWGFFAAGTLGRGDTNRGVLSPAYKFDIDGVTVGADYRMSDKLIFGGTLGYTKQDNDLTGSRGSLGTRGWSVSGYGTWYHADSWYVDGVASYGRNSYEIDRHVRYSITGPLGTTTIDNEGHASGDGDSFTFALSVGRDFNKNGFGFGPYLRGMYTKMTFSSLSEEFDQSLPGSGFALELDTRDVTSLTSTLGAKLTYAHSASWGVLIPHVQLEWQHEFENDPAQVEARFLFDPLATPFTIHGDEIDQDFFRFGLGMSFVLTKGRSGFFYYERLINRERFAQNSLALGIRLEF
jgi:uncharacterized repeat protein (TIGR01451 family)